MTTQEKDKMETSQASSNFIQTIIEDDLHSNKHDGQVTTRFPPEPNGYLHIGHAKSICLNFGMAKRYQGKCHLRFDDTNPSKEDIEYVEAIQKDVKWLGFDWGENLFHASDYFEIFYAHAIHLIKTQKAYVCSLNEEEIRAYRGTVTEAGRPSPYRERTVEENLDLLGRMRAGEFPDGAHTLRAKIDMGAANMKMRDPLLYRIRHTPHDRTGDTWCIYPMYDFAHCLSDAQEGITHSICTLEFENNRELYDWLIDHVPIPSHQPKQYEFARLNLTYTVMSKRKLLELVESGAVDGWDDPRMPTIAGLRRRGYTPESIQDFAERIGVAKANSVVDVGMLEYSLRDDLNQRSARIMAVMNPLRLVITNYPEGKKENLSAPTFPQDPSKEEKRNIPFTRTAYIEHDDFMETPTKGFHRLTPGKEVRLRYGYVVRCEQVIKNPTTGEVEEVHCTYDPETLGRNPEGRKVKTAIHWVSADDALRAEVHLYERLFKDEDPDSAAASSSLEAIINPDSRMILKDIPIESSFKNAHSHYQFERVGYFVPETKKAKGAGLIFNRTVTLKDSWAKETKEPAQAQPKKQETKPKGKSQEEERAAKREARERSFKQDPELASKFKTYMDNYGLSEDDASGLALQPTLSNLFEQAYAASPKAQPIANWLLNEVAGALKEQEEQTLLFSGQAIAELVDLIEAKVISSKIAKTVFAHMLSKGGAPKTLVKELGLEQINDPQALTPIIEKLISKHTKEADEFRQGQAKRLGFFVGQVMRQTEGKANPPLTNKLVKELLEK